MKKVIGALHWMFIIIVIVAMLGVMYLAWLFKWWIIGGSIIVGFINVAIEKVTGKTTALTRWIEK